MIDNSIFKTGSVTIASHRQPDSAFSIAAPLSLFLYSFLTGDFVPVLALMDAQHPCPKGDDQYQRDVHIASMVDGLTF